MIESYNIKFENNEEVLYIYLNYNYEFASFNKNDKSFFKELKKIINNKFLNFKGHKIVLIASGIIIGTIFLNNININTNNNYNNIDNNKYVQTLILNDFNGYDKYIINTDTDKNINNELLNNNKTQINEKITTNNIKINNNKTNNNQENNNITTNSTNTQNQENNNITTNTTNTQNQENNNNNEITQEKNVTTEIENIEDSKKIVTIYRKNGEVLNIELEEYLIGVVAGEMPASFNIEALKVQAIIARTYTLKSISRNKILTDTVDTQVYIDNEEMHNKWGTDFNKYYNKIKDAVNSTEGLIITYNNTLIDAVYFANSNGYTEDAKEVWGYNIPYLKSVECSYDINTRNYQKNITISYEELSNKLNMNIDNNVEIYNILRNSSHRIISISINDLTYTGIELRNLLNLRSADFDINITDSGLEFITYGYGHGVGVSQYGANGMANNGNNYESIIKYFYNNVSIEKNT